MLGFTVGLIVTSILLIALNRLLYYEKNTQLPYWNRIFWKGSTTFEFGAESMGTADLVVNNQFIILGIIFILFDLEVVFLIPWVLCAGALSGISKLVIIIFANFLFLSLAIELWNNILVWYDNKFAAKL